MHSPIDSHVTLEAREIEPGLAGYECPKSGGVWLPLQSYLKWKESNPAPAPAQPEGSPPEIADDSKQPAHLCPFLTTVETGSVVFQPQ